MWMSCRILLFCLVQRMCCDCQYRHAPAVMMMRDSLKHTAMHAAAPLFV